MPNEEVIRILETQIQAIQEKAETDIAELKAAIARLRSDHVPAASAAAPAVAARVTRVTPGQYKGMKIATALQAYLSERGGGPVSFAQLMRDLESGEAELGSVQHRSRWPRNIKITITNNARTFRYDEKADTVELARHGSKAVK